ncbi:hypothetical protein C8R44DRAFT_929253 [Mycena epipterygia]|nr:hypothetical protein C8R44DRAFT_929253 [Mycena epipterygia]
MSLDAALNLLTGLTPVPGLHSAFTVFRFIISSVQATRASKKQLIVLANAVAQLLGTLQREFKARTLSQGACTQPIEDLVRLLNDIYKFVQTEQQRNFLNALLHTDDRVAAIEMFYHRIGTTTSAFQISSSLNIQHMLSQNDQARRDDARALAERFTVLEANHNDLRRELDINHKNMLAMMVSIERRIGDNRDAAEQRFYSHTLQYLVSNSSQHVKLEDWMISLFDVDFGAGIAEGGFGTVYEGTWNRTKVAIKMIHNTAGVTANVKMLRQEIDIWLTLRHPNIIQFLGANTLDDKPFVVMPLLPHNAREFLQSRPDWNPLRILRDITLGLEYLHARKISHGDLKGINVLADNSGQALLCDFGLTRIKGDITSRTRSTQGVAVSGSRNWMAPELLTGALPKLASDIYAFGMTLYELYTDQIPLMAVSHGDFIELVVRLDVRPERPEDDECPRMNDGIWDLAEQCWKKDAKMRLTARQVHDKINLLLIGPKIAEQQPPPFPPESMPGSWTSTRLSPACPAKTVPSQQPVPSPSASMLAQTLQLFTSSKSMPAAVGTVQSSPSVEQSRQNRTAQTVQTAPKTPTLPKLVRTDLKGLELNIYQSVQCNLEKEMKDFLLAKANDSGARTKFLDSALLMAVTNGDSKLVQVLLQNGADPNESWHGVHSAMYTAASKGDLQVLGLLLPGAEVGTRNDALDAACQNGHMDVAGLLLNNGAIITEITLCNACRKDNIEIVQLLLQQSTGPGNTFWVDFQRAFRQEQNYWLYDQLRIKHLLGSRGLLRQDDYLFEDLLWSASRNGLPEIVRLLLDKGANPNDNRGFDGTPLCAAAHKIDIFRLLIQRGADVNAKDSLGIPVLHKVSADGQDDIIRLLIQNGADVNAQGGTPGTGRLGTALEGAACRGMYDNTVALLLANGADATVQGGPFGGALQAACDHSNAEAILLLIAHGADVNAQGGSALRAACKRGNSGIAYILVNNGADINLEALYPIVNHNDNIASILEEGAKDKSNKNVSVLQQAAKAGDLGRVRSLLAIGSNVNEEGGINGTALKSAAKFGHIEVVRLLLEHGAHINSKGGRHGSALQDAAAAGHTEIVRLLVQNGANGTMLDIRSGGNAFISASRLGRTEIVRLLLQSGAGVNAERPYIGDAVYAASYHGHIDLIRLLLQNGGNANAGFQIACSRTNIDVVRLLIEKGADINANHGAALYAACGQGHMEISRLLMGYGADVNLTEGCQTHGSALQAAVASGNLDLVRLLVAQGANMNWRGGCSEVLWLRRLRGSIWRLLASFGSMERKCTHNVLCSCRK